ncbi:MAG: hypothetical protein IT416_03855 [Candidatus Pacebacteria bacterium]|nr:hypothetical protein [Candidatus Paceibacterota bacterium]
MSTIFLILRAVFGLLAAAIFFFGTGARVRQESTWMKVLGTLVFGILCVAQPGPIIFWFMTVVNIIGPLLVEKHVRWTLVLTIPMAVGAFALALFSL